MSDFIRRKVVWMELGITDMTLYNRINSGEYPPLQTQVQENGSSRKGYYKETFEKVKQTKTVPRGRPTK